MGKKTDAVDRNKIYAVKVAGAESASSIALYADLNYYDFEGICFLTPPDRGHMIEGRFGKKTKNGFTFIPDGSGKGEWEFVEVTYGNFCEEFHRIVEGSDEILAEVSNTEQLQEWYHRRFPM